MKPLFQNIHTVLVRTKYSSNIGSAARATANISKNGKLILIESLTSIDENSYKMAAGARKVLKEHESFPNWSDFFKEHPLGIRLGLTRRSGKRRKIYSLPEAIRQSAQSKELHNQPLYLIFGSEDRGLLRTDLDQCHMACNLPAQSSFESLNLAQAVLLAHYICTENIESLNFNESSYKKGRMENTQHTNLFPDQLFIDWLISSGFQIDLSKHNIFYTLRRMILRSIPTSSEIELLKKAFYQSLKIHKTLEHPEVEKFVS